jgi:hypothetical protein
VAEPRTAADAIDPVDRATSPATTELIAELEGALAAARAQLRLLRGSLATLIGFLERPPG